MDAVSARLKPMLLFIAVSPSLILQTPSLFHSHIWLHNFILSPYCAQIYSLTHSPPSPLSDILPTFSFPSSALQNCVLCFCPSLPKIRVLWTWALSIPQNRKKNAHNREAISGGGQFTRLGNWPFEGGTQAQLVWRCHSFSQHCPPGAGGFTEPSRNISKRC